MKHKLQLWVMMLFSVLLSINQAWGEGTTATINFNNGSGTAISSASVTGNDSQSNQWTITTVGTTSYTANASYYQVGKSSEPATSITFTTTLAATKKITSMSAKFGGFNSTAGSVTLKVGDNTIGTGSLNASSDVTVSSTDGTKTGTVLTVTVTNIAKGVKCYYISYTFEDGTTYTDYLTECATQYDVKFYVGGGEDTDLAQKVVEGGNPTAVTDPSKTGYTFDGWYEASDFSGDKIADVTSVTISADKNFYGRFNPKKMTISFNPAGGNWSGSTANINKTYTYDGAAVEFPANPEKTNYDFLGWFDDSQEPAVEVKAIGTTLKPESNLTLTAHWQLSALTVVTLVKNTEEASTCPATFDVLLGNAVNVCTDLTKTGYDLVGFFDENDVKVFNADGSLAESSYSSEGNWAFEGRVLTIAAKWNAHTYAITYNNVDPSEHTNPASLTIVSAAIALVDAERSGYAFRGWYSNSGFEGDPVTTIAAGTHDNVVLWAKWVEAKNVAWMVNGAALVTGSQDTRVLVGEKVATLPDDPVLDCGDKEFVGWAPLTEHYTHATDAPANLFKTAAEAPVVNDDVTYYAVFANVAGGETIELTFPDDNSNATTGNKVSSYNSEWEAHVGTGANAIKFDIANFNNNSWNNNWAYIKTGSKNGAIAAATVTTKAALPNKIAEIQIDFTIDDANSDKFTSANLYVASTADGLASAEGISINKEAGVQSVKIASPAADMFYQVKLVTAQGSANGFVWINSVKYIEELDITNYSTKCRALDHIVVDATNAPKSFYVGDEFSYAGATVTAHFDDLTTKDVTAEAGFAAPAMDVAGDGKTVTVSYEDKEDSYTVNVQAITLTGIEVTNQPSRTVYGIGDAFDVTGMTVMAHYNDNRKDKAIVLKVGEEDGYTVSPATFTATGIQNVTLNYGGLTAEVEVTVNAALTGITVDASAVKTEYSLGETLDLTGLVVKAQYNDLSEATITTYTTDPANGTKLTDVADSKTITVNYIENGVTKSETFTVKVNALKVTFISKENQTGAEVTEEVAGEGVTPPTVGTTVGLYTFYGWSETNVTEETTDVPTLVNLTDGKYFPTEPKTLYAVYTTNKDAQKYGFYLTAVVDAESTEKTIGSLSSNSFYPVTTGSPLAFWFEEDKYLVHYASAEATAPTYYYNTTSDAKIESGNKTNVGENYWEEIENADGTVSYKRSEGRVLAWNSSYFRAYNPSSYTFCRFTKTQSSEYHTESVAHYTSNPSSAMTAGTSFTLATVSTTVLDEEGNLNTYSQDLNRNGHDGVITYSLSGENALDIASIDPETGVVTAKKGGTVTVVASIAEVADTWNAETKSYELTFNKMVPTVSNTLAVNPTLYVGYSIDAADFFTTTSDGAKTYTLSSYANAEVNGSMVTAKGNPGGSSWVNVHLTTAETDIYAAKTTTSTTGSQQVNLRPLVAQNISFAQSKYTFVYGEEIEDFTNTLSGAMTTVTYVSSNPAVAEVDATGKVHVLNSEISGAVTITATAAAEMAGGIGYSSKEASYTIYIKHAAPVHSLAAGEYHKDQLLELTAGDDAWYIYYTTNGENVAWDGNESSNGIEYTNSGVLLEKGTTTIKAIAIYLLGDEYVASAQSEYTYNLVAPAQPVFSWTDEANVKQSDVLTITCASNCYIDYVVKDEDENVVQSGHRNVSPVSLDIPAMGKYIVEAYTFWKDENKEDSYKSEMLTSSFKMQGPASLPYAYKDFQSMGVPGCFDNHVGGTYSAATNPNIQLKFTNQGQYIVFQCDEQINNLYYTIRHNITETTSFEAAGDKFVVSTSADGVSYTTLKEYTTMESSKETNEKILSGIPATARYIKWEYKTKGTNGGNIGLGNIKVGLLDVVFSGTEDVLMKPDDMLEWTVSAAEYDGELHYEVSASQDDLLYEDGVLYAFESGVYNISVTAPETNRYKEATTTVSVEIAEKYTRPVTTTIGTICLPKAVDAGDFSGATFYQIVYKDNATNAQVTKVFFDEVDRLEAGKPYIFIPTEGATDVVCYMHGMAEPEAKDVNGLVGVFGLSADTYEKVYNSSIETYQYYIFSAGQIRRAGIGVDGASLVPNNRAYIDMNDVPTENAAPAPVAGRKRISLSNISYVPGMTTDVENVENASEQVEKQFINGVIFIIRGGKMYDLNGRLAK